MFTQLGRCSRDYLALDVVLFLCGLFCGGADDAMIGVNIAAEVLFDMSPSWGDDFSVYDEHLTK